MLMLKMKTIRLRYLLLEILIVKLPLNSWKKKGQNKMAEGKGFEPPKGISSFNDLANRRLQPLGHPSAKGSIVKWAVKPHGVCIICLRAVIIFVKQEFAPCP